ncbi:MAG: oxidoreductase [Pyrinomonadaceae bacterium]|nr:oxidoreductase [Sphingobacteriaceae bacterium]
MKRIAFLTVFQILLFIFISEAQTITLLDSGKNTSIRGLSVVTNSVAWISGSNGYTALTNDAGKTWKWKQLSGYENLDFRDIEAFSAREAIIVSAGTPAIILKTIDGGSSWKEVYRENSVDIFLDGMDFWNKNHGIVYGDPIKGKMQLLETRDGGNTWKNITINLKVELAEGEASFAASGTAIRTAKRGNVWIATGGMQSRIFHSDNFGKTWEVYKCPIVQGNNSSGPFSLAIYKGKNMVAAGGNYLIDTLRDKNLVLSDDGGKTWSQPSTNLFGYRSAIEYISKKVLIATGTSGTDLSTDGGQTWRTISTVGFNSVRKGKKGNFILLAGPKGKIARFQIF